MSLIAFDLTAESSDFLKGIGQALETLERFEEAVTRTQKVADDFAIKAPKAEGGASGGAESIDAGAAQASDQAAQIQGSFASALRPLAQFAGQIAGQFDRVGGTIITLARRIDASMKLKSIDEALTKIHSMEERFGATTRAAAGIARVGFQIHSTWSSLGDVAGKTASSLMGLNLARPLRQVVSLKFAFQSVQTTVNRLKFSIVALGAELVAAFGGFMLIFKGVQFLKDSTREASNLNETINKTGLIFDAQASLVTAAADQMAARYGTLKTSFLDVADQYGQLLQGMGRQTKAASAATSVELTKLTADASSLFNEGFEEASRRISSALRGQSEPISAWGIDVTEAAVKQEAMRMGLAKLGQELDTSQKVAARTSLVMRGLAVAQGDLARTGEQPANAARRFAGSIQNAGAALMANFLPALQKGLGLLNEFATYLNDAIARNQASITAFAAGVGAAMETAGRYLRNLPAVWDVVVLKFQEGVANVAAVLRTIPENFQIVGDWLAANWYPLLMKGIDLAIKALGKLLEGVAWLHGMLLDILPPIALAIGKAIAVGIWKGFKGGITALVSGGGLSDLPQLVAPKFADLSKEIEAKFKAIAGPEKGPAAGGGAASLKTPARSVPPPIDTGAMEAMKKLEEKAKSAFDDTRTPIEKFRARMAEVGEMFAKGLIDQETYNRAKKAADDDFRGKAKSVFDETRTPLEKFQARLTELKGYLDQGMIDKTTFDRAKKSAMAEMQPEEKKYAGALELGSTEARSAALKYRGAQGGDTGIKDVAKNTGKAVDLQQKAVDLLSRLVGKAADKALQAFEF